MDNTDFLINFLLYIPGIIVTAYIAIYTTLHFSFFRLVEKRRNTIRHAVAESWQKQYGGFIGIIDNIHVKYIRTMLRRRVNESKRFRMWQAIYIVYSIVIVLIAVAYRSCKTLPVFTIHVLIMAVMIFSVMSTALFIASYSEWKFYVLLDELDKTPNQARHTDAATQ